LQNIASGKESKLIIPSKINFESIDYFLYIPKDQFKAIKGSNLKTLGIDIKNKGNLLFVCQVKKDFTYTCNNYKSICEEWEKSKTKIENMMKEINTFFILVNNSKSVDSGKQVTKFEKAPKDDIFVLFTDTLNSTYFYGKYE